MQNSYKDQYKIKRHKDLQFLTQIPYIDITDKIHKYPLSQGKDNTIIQINLPITIYYNYQKYDYTGKLLQKVVKKSTTFPKDPSQTQHPLFLDAIYHMKLNQKAWFNIQFSQRGQKDYNGFNGYHYEIFIESFVYKNDSTLVSKKNIYQQNREKAKELFKNKKYKEALKIYKNSINILSGLSKKIYKPEELQELNKYLQISQSNYLKCVAKLSGFGGRYNQQIGKTTKQICDKFIKKYPQSPASFYQKAIFLKYYNMFDAASESIKQGLKKTFSQNIQQAAQQKKSLLNMLEYIKKTKQRNIRHLKRQQIRKKKTEKKVNDIWNDDDQLSDDQ